MIESANQGRGATIPEGLPQPLVAGGAEEDAALRPALRSFFVHLDF